MKIGFSSPYFDSLSGGERYALTLASHWSKSHKVSLFWDEPGVLRKAESRFNIDLSAVRTVENVFKTRNVFKKMMVSRGYDCIFFLTDGSIPTTFCRHNILHFQVPFQHIPVHPIKLSRFQAIVCNSDFTKRNITARLGRRAIVIYPPVTPIKPARVAKKKMILSVGRLHPLKKHDVLVEAFGKGKFEGYELVLTGGLLPADAAYVKRLMRLASGLPVRLLPNISFDKLSLLYNHSSIYWHAAGFGETNPENMEHFGISTVEAMSAGSIPVVFDGGGLPEIVREGEEGYLWKNADELCRKTKQIMAGGTSKFTKSAVVRSQQFSVQKFTQSFDALLADIAG